MNYYLINAVAVASVAAILPANVHAAEHKVGKPNIILILSDDQGYCDLGCYGAKDLQTPNIDRLAAEGTRFTQFYAGGSVSSPSRASLLTGRSSLEAGCPGNVPRRRQDQEGNKGLPQSNRTMAENLKEAGYYTALVGKWHLGEGPEQLPNKQGFDYFFGHRGGCFDNFSHFFYWSGPNEHDLWRNNEEVYYPGSYFLDLIVDEVGTVIEAEREAPFFIYCAFNVPHYPYQGDKKWLDYYSDRGLTTPRKEYNAFVSTMDERIGRIIDKLKQEGKYDNTLIIFQSDQGYSVEERAFWGGGNAGDLRGCKGSLFEGGICVPAIIKHKGVAPAGMVIDVMAAGVDWYNTLAEVAGAEISSLSQGKSLLSLLRGETKEHHTIMNWQVNSFDDKKGQWAVRSGEWKLIGNVMDPRDHNSLTDEDKKLFLSNLKIDITESNNLAAEYPEKVAELKALHDQWYIRAQQSTEFRFRTGK